MKTIAFDFDGVINSYKNGWNKGVDNLTEPNEDVINAIKYYKDQGNKIIIFTTRGNDEHNKSLIIDYLKKYDIPYDKITDRKEPWVVLIDDRCICYNENNKKNLIDLINHYL